MKVCGVKLMEKENLGKRRDGVAAYKAKQPRWFTDRLAMSLGPHNLTERLVTTLRPAAMELPGRGSSWTPEAETFTCLPKNAESARLFAPYFVHTRGPGCPVIRIDPNPCHRAASIFVQPSMVIAHRRQSHQIG